MAKGFIQIYTGDGKGKTTAALGLTLRAIGAGKKVYIGQFLKNGDYSEIKTLKKLQGPQLKIEQFGVKRPVTDPMSREDNEAALGGIRKVETEMSDGGWDLIILDEFNIIADMQLVDTERLKTFISNKPEETELVLTGRGAPDWLRKKAGLITEMKMIRHYYNEGIQARKGIEF